MNTPKLIYGRENSLYMIRWKIAQRGDQTFYFHVFLRDDEDPPHDHPFDFTSIVLAGSYKEEIVISWVDGIPRNIMQVERKPFVPVFRQAQTAHRVILPKDEKGNPLPCLTLMIAGPKSRGWGFHTMQGWKDFQTFFKEAGIPVSGDGTE
jgi:hypothetical protein